MRREEDAILLALKLEEGAMSQRMQEPLAAGRGSPPEPPEGMQPC